MVSLMAIIQGTPDWIIYYMISQYVVLGIAGGYWVWKTRFKIGFEARFLRKELSGYVLVGTKEFNSKDELISYKDKKFKVDLEKLGYRQRGFQYLYYDYDNGNLLTFGGEKEVLDPYDAGLFLASGILQRILAIFKGVGMFPIVVISLIVVFCVLCFSLGVLSSPYILGVA